MSPSRTPKKLVLEPYIIPSEPKWFLRGATPADAEFMAPRLSKATLAELAAMSDATPQVTLAGNLSQKSVIIEKRKDACPVLMLEVASAKEGGKAVYWSCIIDDVHSSREAWTLNEYARSVLNLLARQYSPLITFVLPTNIRHKIWLEHVGFEYVGEAAGFSKDGGSFDCYRRTRI